MVTANAAGTATITATSVADPSKSASATVTVVDTLTFQDYSAVVATAGQAIPTQNASVAGGSPPYAFSAVDPLPAGLILDSTTGAITGTPTTAGSYSAVIRVTDTAGYFTDATFAITVNPAPTLTYTSPINVPTTANGTVVATPTLSGGTGPFTYSQSAVSGPGLGGNFTFSNSTGQFTATTPTAGTYVRSITVTDSNGATATFQITINVTNP